MNIFCLQMNTHHQGKTIRARNMVSDPIKGQIAVRDLVEKVYARVDTLQ